MTRAERKNLELKRDDVQLFLERCANGSPLLAHAAEEFRALRKQLAEAEALLLEVAAVSLESDAEVVQ